MTTETTRMSMSDVVALLMEQESEPEKIAASLMQPFAPDMYLDELDVSGDSGVSDLVQYLKTQRIRRAELEKDEICRFVERNRVALTGYVFPVLEAALVSAEAKAPDDDGTIYMGHFCTQVRHALEGHPERIDTKSGWLFWLLFALGHMVARGRYSHVDAVRLLSRPDHVGRMSRVTLLFMLQEYGPAINTPHQQPVELVMLLLECAMLAMQLPATKLAFRILTQLPPVVDSQAWVDVLVRAFQFLQQQDSAQPSRAPHLRPEDEEFMQRLVGRFGQKVGEDDF